MKQRLRGVLGLGLLGLLALLPGSAQEGGPQIYGGGTFSPGARVGLEYSLPGGGSAQISLFRITNPERVLELGGPRDFKATGELGLAPVRSLSVYRSRDSSYGQVNLGVLPEGLYLAQIGNPRPRSATLILVTGLGLVVKSDPAGMLTYTADLKQGNPLPAQVYVVKDRKIVAQGRANNGITRLETGFKNGEGVFVVARFGKAWAFSSAYWQAWNVERNRVYLYTDRPVYRPGQTVQFKGIARSTTGLKPLAGQRVTVSVKDESEAEVFSGAFVTDAYGSFSGSLPIGLDARLGNYSLTARVQDQEFSGSFEVQEYVKPEYRVTVTPDKAVAVQGEKGRFVIKGEYLFGGPVAGGKVSYSVLQRPYYRFAYTSPYGFYQNYAYEDSYGGSIIQRGEGRLDEKGELVLEVPLPREAENDYRLSVEAGVTDEARREISGSGALTAYRSGVVLDIRSDSYFYQAGQPLSATVRAEDLEGRPLSVPFSLEVKRSYWLRGQGEQTQTVTVLQGRTDARGKATVSLKLKTQADYRLEVQAKDSAGRSTAASDSVWISDGSYWYWGYKSLKITPDKPEYKVGDTARFVVQSPVTDGWALVNLEGSRVSKPEVVRFRGSVFTYALKLTPEMVPNGYLSVTLLGGGEYYTETAGFLIPPTDKFLNVAIRSDQTTYKPGDSATYTLKVTNAQGQPVQAQVSLGLVDEAIYLVRPESTPDIRGFFWALKGNQVGTETAGGYYFGNVAPVQAVAPRAEMGKAVFGQSKEGLAAAKLRSDFRDTILWLPSVQTDTNGQATVEARFPDNLTQWRMTARAITRSDTVGQSVQTVTTTLPVIARLGAPRFLVKGDTALLRVIGQNNLTTAQSGQLQLEPSGLNLLTPPTRLTQFPAGGRSTADYRMSAPESGTAILKASALTPAASDALQIQLPVLPKGLKEELGWAGQTTGSSGRTTGSSDEVGTVWSFVLPENTDLRQTKARLYLNPSLATAVTPALEYLAGYPYGCSEQTMSRFLPSVLAKQAGALVTLPEEVRANLDDYVAQGLKRLYDFQHEDGGWGFWQNDSSSLYITAYVLSGLIQAQQAGYTVRKEVLENGAAYLKRALARPGTDRYTNDARAYGLYALAYAGEGGSSGQTVTALISSFTPKDLAAFSPYGLSLLTLAAQQIGDRASANRLLEALLGGLVEREQVAYWDVDTYPYAWNDDRVEATARGLQALIRLRPDSPVIPKIVNWLMLERRGARWVSTKDTAAVVVAALELAKARGEQPGESVVQVRVNGQEQSLSVGPQGLELPLEGLQLGSNRVEILSETPLFASGSVGYFVESEYLKPEYKGLRVARQYEKLTPKYDPKNERYTYTRSPLSGPVKSGEYVLVTLTLRPEKGVARYVLLEEPTPAGLSVVENDEAFRIAGVRSRYGDDYYGWNYWFDGREIRDSKIAFYFSYLNGPVTFTYILRAETPGSFTALPTLAWLMYEPEVRGVGTVRTLSVSE
ncbi:alpha-2-macroglobulin family protein [Meiothermus granaticius]|uniref:Putative lipoprotein YfhM n=1 Tax=Meiothermus granaticius NBRC 107808 TaxID=1227551 RepID=A0A399FA56_9DEIN|nr:MG2 domain-containing protein [Meiothermus granaticius]RIH91792.1 putative lipoprotein YfhM [Meiothermus granaticius NBRC 107808]GEM87896.1 hypothetical protein MGR01S_25210 [Meiothermus granaticius NBRC 107808]